MKTKKKILLAALFFAVLSAYLIYQFLGGMDETQETKAERIIFIAKTDLAPGSEISNADVEKMEISIDAYVPGSALSDMKEIVGKTAKDRIVEGEIFVEERLVDDDEKDLTFFVPQNKRAISVNTDEFSGVGDMIKPNDHVDIYITAYEKSIETANSKIYMPETSILLLQNIQVLAVSKEKLRTDEDEREEIPNNYAVTVAVTAEEGEKLVLGEEMGSIKFALRPFGDDSICFTPGVVRDDLVTDKGKISIPR